MLQMAQPMNWQRLTVHTNETFKISSYLFCNITKFSHFWYIRNVTLFFNKYDLKAKTEEPK